MDKKQQFSFKINTNILSDFDKALNEFKNITGIKPIRQDSIEMAMKDYIIKLRKQIEILKSKEK